MTPNPQIDPAILGALSLPASTTKITPHGGSGFTSTFRLTSTPISTTLSQTFFIKISSNPSASTMFRGEHTSLNAIHTVVPSLCPRSFAWGKLDQDPDSYFLATEFANLKSSHDHQPSKNSSSRGGGMTLPQKLAKLHTTPAPLPTTSHSTTATTPQFGFPVPTCCGDTPQPNPFTASWPDFFAQHRLRFILGRGERRNGADAELRSLVERTAETVVPRLLGCRHLGGTQGIVPVVVHGDLWSGNRGLAVFPGRRDGGDQSKTQSESPSSQSQSRSRSQSLSQFDTDDTETSNNDHNYCENPSETPEEIIYDPSSTYAHSEYELGIMQMFGGFSAAFMREYHNLVPKTEPVEEYEDRVSLYESYHHLNHWAIFGATGYREGAVGILGKLVRRYGGGNS